jgi:glycosyltransferase involved in cell wall biosynthesis
MEVVSVRPGVAENRTAFEAMAEIYKYIQAGSDINFRIVTDVADGFSDPDLQVSRIPRSAWKTTVPHVPVFLRRDRYVRHIDPLIKSADVVLTLDPTIFYQAVLIINKCHKKDTPVLFDASKTIADTDPHWRLIRPRIGRAVSRASGVVATTPKVLERFRDIGLLYQLDLSAFTVMGHPVDTERFHPPDEEYPSAESTRILTVSRLVPEKGLYYLLEAVTPVLQDGDATFHILGEGPMEPLLRNEAEQRGIADKVSFLGTVPHRRVPEVLRSADIFVNHAVTIDRWEEYFGAANLEAMACGLPCVVSECGGVPFAIREDNVAEFVSQRDVAALRESIKTLCEDPARRAALGGAAREYVEQQYSIATIGDHYRRMLRAAVR